MKFRSVMNGAIVEAVRVWAPTRLRGYRQPPPPRARAGEWVLKWDTGPEGSLSHARFRETYRRVEERVDE